MTVVSDDDYNINSENKSDIPKTNVNRMKNRINMKNIGAFKLNNTHNNNQMNNHNSNNNNNQRKNNKT